MSVREREWLSCIFWAHVLTFPELRRRIFQEIHVMRKLAHPNIVQFLCYCMDVPTDKYHQVLHDRGMSMEFFESMLHLSEDRAGRPQAAGRSVMAPVLEERASRRPR